MLVEYIALPSNLFFEKKYALKFIDLYENKNYWTMHSYYVQDNHSNPYNQQATQYIE